MFILLVEERKASKNARRIQPRECMSTVLVTGGSGFVGSHIIIKLLEAGYEVRTTVRSLQRADPVRAMIKVGGSQDASRLTFHAADLLKDAGWTEAVEGCDFLLHVASPFPSAVPKDENELIIPAREGTVRVLRAAREAGVKRVVVTSSFAAVGYGLPFRETPFTELDWTDPAGPEVAPYIKSKVLAERAAWEFVSREGGNMELAVINPVGIFGPALGPDFSSSIGLVKALLDGALPATPRIYFGVVDVRDVADLHVLAMVRPEAKGQRFIAVTPGPVLSMQDAAQILHRHLGQAAERVPRRQFPDWMVRLLAPFSPGLRNVLPQLGIVRSSTSAKAERLLGWTPRSAEEAIAASGESLVRLGLVRIG